MPRLHVRLETVVYCARRIDVHTTANGLCGVRQQGLPLVDQLHNRSYRTIVELSGFSGREDTPKNREVVMVAEDLAQIVENLSVRLQGLRPGGLENADVIPMKLD